MSDTIEKAEQAEKHRFERRAVLELHGVDAVHALGLCYGRAFRSNSRCERCPGTRLQHTDLDDFVGKDVQAGRFEIKKEDNEFSIVFWPGLGHAE